MNENITQVNGEMNLLRAAEGVQILSVSGRLPTGRGSREKSKRL